MTRREQKVEQRLAISTVDHFVQCRVDRLSQRRSAEPLLDDLDLCEVDFEDVLRREFWIAEPIVTA